MNKELKEQARKEFDEKFPKTLVQLHDDGLGWSKNERTDIKSFIDSLIDKTVQQTEERIAWKRDKIWELLCAMDTNIKSEKEYADEIISLITNKNDNK